MNTYYIYDAQTGEYLTSDACGATPEEALTSRIGHPHYGHHYYNGRKFVVVSRAGGHRQCKVLTLQPVAQPALQAVPVVL